MLVHFSLKHEELEFICCVKWATFDRINSSYLTDGVSDAAFKDLVSVRVNTNTAVFKNIPVRTTFVL